MDTRTIVGIAAIGLAVAAVGGRLLWSRWQWRTMSGHGSEVAAWARSHRWRVRRSDPRFVKRFQGEPFARPLHRTGNPACRHVVTGLHDLRPFVHLDHQHDEDGGPTTCCVAVALPTRLPDLTVRPQAEAGQALILEGLHAESEEFDRRYEVIAQDAGFTYAFLHPQAMEQLMRLPADATVRVERADILCYRRTSFTPAELEQILDVLGTVVGLLPEQLRQPEK